MTATTEPALPEPPLPMRNRRTIADRTGWPEHAAQECERLEAVNPGWHVTWHPESKLGPDPVFHRKQGYYAHWAEDTDPGYMSPVRGYQRRPEWYGATVAEIEKRLAPREPGRYGWPHRREP